jgi:hypothetical protein
MNFKALALSALVATTAIAGGSAAQAGMGSFSFNPPARSSYNYTPRRTTVRPSFGGGYNINHGNGNRSTVRPSFGGGYNINSYGW